MGLDEAAWKAKPHWIPDNGTRKLPSTDEMFSGNQAFTIPSRGTASRVYPCSEIADDILLFLFVLFCLFPPA